MTETSFSANQQQRLGFFLRPGGNTTQLKREKERRVKEQKKDKIRNNKNTMKTELEKYGKKKKKRMDHGFFWACQSICVYTQYPPPPCLYMYSSSTSIYIYMYTVESELCRVGCWQIYTGSGVNRVHVRLGYSWDFGPFLYILTWPGRQLPTRGNED
jgi:hypothetical protein